MTNTEKIRSYVKRKIEYLYNNIDSSDVKATMAELRRGLGKTPGDIPKLWGIILKGMPEEMYSKTGDPSYAEWAVYIALTLYAYHQQGESVCVNVEGISIGNAASRLCKGDEDRKRVEHRFFPVVTAADMPEFNRHLRTIVQLLKADGIKLDYPMLAADIYTYQLSDSVSSVKLRWGQDFYRINNNKESEDTNND